MLCKDKTSCRIQVLLSLLICFFFRSVVSYLKPIKWRDVSEFRILKKLSHKYYRTSPMYYIATAYGLGKNSVNEHTKNYAAKSSHAKWD